MVRAQTVYAVGGYAIPDFASPDPIGSSTPNSGVFTTLAASGAVSGAGFTAYFASPPAIGGTTPAAATFTNVTATNATVSGTLTAETFTATVSTSGFVGPAATNNSSAAATGSVYNAYNDLSYQTFIGTLSSGYASSSLFGPNYGAIYSQSKLSVTTSSTEILFGINGTSHVATMGTSGVTAAFGYTFNAYAAATAPYSMGGKIHVNTTAVGNVGAGTDDLMTYNLPADVLGSDGKAIRVTAWGTVANNAAAKAATFNFGATSLSLALRSNQDGVWRVEFLVIRTGSNAQTLTGRFQGGPVNAAATDHLTFAAAPAETDSGAITIKCTGAATSDNDIVQKGMIVEFIS